MNNRTTTSQMIEESLAEYQLAMGKFLLGASGVNDAAKCSDGVDTWTIFYAAQLGTTLT